MRTEAEQVAHARNRAPGRRRYFVGRIRLLVSQVDEDRVDLSRLKPCDVELKLDLGQEHRQLLQLNCKQLAAPAGLFGEAVVRKRIGPNSGLAQMADRNCGDLREPEETRGFEPTVAGNHPPMTVDNDRVDGSRTPESSQRSDGSASSSEFGRFGARGRAPRP